MSDTGLIAWLVHHGEALTPDIDPSRPLSERGRAAVDALAAVIAARGVHPRIVWHSGKLRARQTAEAFWRSCNPLGTCLALRGLQPADPPEWVATHLAGEDGVVLLVGHMPHLPRLLRLLVTGDQDRGPQFPEHGAVCVELQERRWREVWRSG